MVPHDSGGPTLEPWQVINLIGAPLLALIFVRPVIDDLKGWWAARGTTHPDGSN
ncbi:MAG TPA: hypothetical protein VFR33_07250 [Candidatus Dormibacteraeota bacterium]|nr:hypothetical protein [Candidatus Dormibacteraeota bacterium]